jgi:hypothetical protein
MTDLEMILIAISTILSSLLAVSLYFNFKHGVLIISLTESIEEVLDILDERYNSISQVLEIPLFYDSPQVRKVVEDIKVCRDSLLKSAHALIEVQQENYHDD